jgi:hypothetical protein
MLDIVSLSVVIDVKQYDNTQRLKSSEGLATEDQNLRRNDAHETQKGKHQINDRDGSWRIK